MTVPDLTRGDPPGVYACVVDQRRRFHLEALRWFAALTGVAGVSAEDLLIQMVGDTASVPLRWLRAQGVTVRPLDGFDPKKRHTNKIAGALALARSAESNTRSGGVPGLAVLTDSDVAICEDLRLLTVRGRSIAMKIVDIDNPPFETVQRIFAAAGLPLPEVRAPDFAPDRRTISINGNGGVYIVPAGLLPELADAWAHWARWLLARLDELGLKRAIDQMAMALTVAAEKIEVIPLARRFNLPIQFPEWLQNVESPAVLHYHQAVDRDGLIRTTGNSAVDQRIEVANGAILEVYERVRSDTGLRVRRPFVSLPRR